MNDPVTVERVSDASASPIMDQFAKIIGELGHPVVRWEMGNDEKGIELLPTHPHAFLWQGIQSSYRVVAEAAVARGVQVHYVGRGYAGEDSYQVDPLGVGPRASWATNVPLPEADDSAMRVIGGPILLWVQHDHDPMITEYSPWWNGDGVGEQLLDTLLRSSSAEFLVRVPSDYNQEQRSRLDHLLAKKKLMPSFAGQSFEWFHREMDIGGLATVNDDVGYRALKKGYPVLCFGNAFWRQDRVVFDLDDRFEHIARAVRQVYHSGPLANRRMPILQSRVNAFIKHVQGCQWSAKELPARLKDLLK